MVILCELFSFQTDEFRNILKIGENYAVHIYFLKYDSITPWSPEKRNAWVKYQRYNNLPLIASLQH